MKYQICLFLPIKHFLVCAFLNLSDVCKNSYDLRLQKYTHTTAQAPTKRGKGKQGDKHLPALVLGTDDRYSKWILLCER